MKLVELKVAQLKSELSLRGLEKNGVKAALVDRLKKALEKEGHDPLLFEFGDEEFPNESMTSENDSSQIEKDESSNQNDENHAKTGAGVSSSTSLVGNESSLSLASLSSIPPAPTGGILTVQDVIDLSTDVKSPDDYSVIAQVDETETLKLELGAESTSNEEDGCSNQITMKSDNNSIDSKENGDRFLDYLKKETEKKDLSESPNLWVTNINDSVSAVELKQLFSDHGKVISAKIVVNAKTDPPKRFGYLQMSTPTDADNCIQNLNDYEYEGHAIQIKKAKIEPSSSKKSEKSKIDLKKEVKVDNIDNEERQKKEKPFFSEPSLTIKRLEKRTARNYRTLKSTQPLINSRSSRSYAEILAAKKKASYGIRGGLSTTFHKKPLLNREAHSREVLKSQPRLLIAGRPVKLTPSRRLNSSSLTGRDSSHSISMRGASNPSYHSTSMRMREYKDMGFTDRDAYYAIKREKFMQTKVSHDVSNHPHRRYSPSEFTPRFSSYSSPPKRHFNSNTPLSYRETSRSSYHRHADKYPPHDRQRGYTSSTSHFSRGYQGSSYNPRYSHREYTHEKHRPSVNMQHPKSQNYYSSTYQRNSSFSDDAYYHPERSSRTSSRANYHSQSRSNYPPSHSRNIPRSMELPPRDYNKRLYRSHPYMEH